MEMTVAQKNKLFLENQKMMHKFAHYTRKFRLDYEEAKSEAYLVFMETLQMYDANYGIEFSTFLYSRLRSITDTLMRDRMKHVKNVTDAVLETICIEEQYNKLSETYLLSGDAQKIVNFILSRDWEDVEAPAKRLPRCSYLQKYFFATCNWSNAKTKRLYNEICVWWNSANYGVQYAK